MSYLKPEIREILNNGADPQTMEELSYIITKILDEYLLNRFHTYEVHAGIVGMLETTKLEYIRRVLVPYEKSRIRCNGDVYSSQNTEEKL